MELIISGIPASPGIAEGVVRIVRDIRTRDDFEEGDILVTKYTEPSMVLMMNRAAAIVTDIGGLMGHAAIISRELGIPCVTATQRGSELLKEGAHVRVDGHAGAVYSL